MMRTSAFILVILFSAANAARILGFVPTPSYSHQVPFQPIFKELSLRGHQVTVITANPQNDPLLTNLTEIDLSSSYDIVKNINIPETLKQDFFSIIRFAVNVSTNLFENTLRHPEVSAMIKNESEHFDLVIVEMLAVAANVFPERFGCPFIGISSMDLHNNAYSDIGNPANPVLYPDFNLDVNIPFVDMTFRQRLICFLYEYFFNFFYKQVLLPNIQLIVEKHFGKNFPSIFELDRKASLLFVNTNLILHPIRPLLPNVIRIGDGIHLKKPKPLPRDLMVLLDGARRGVVYCSFGSNVKSKDLSVETQKIILETFAELPYLVLWKFEVDDLIETPENVVISKWFPQQDVLSHPNVVLFITQGGLQSIEEGIYNSMPIIGIPFMGDQFRNVRMLVYRGIALSLDHKNLTPKTFRDAIVEVIKNRKYRDQVKRISKLIRDEPMTGLKRAVWWTEYVIRHKGAPHLRSLEIPFYQYYLLDVIGFFVILILAAVYASIKLLRLSIRIFKYFFVTQKIKTQ